MTYTPEQLREEANTAEADHAAGHPVTVDVDVFVQLARAHAAALEELERVKRAIAESCDEQRGEYFGCRRAERAEAALAKEKAAHEVTAAEKQAKIDALMLEYCPDEMTREQVAEWERHQRASRAEFKEES